MIRQSRFGLALFLGLLAGAVALVGLQAADNPKADPGKAETRKTEKTASKGPAVAVKPKPLSDQVKKALAYLAGQQHEDGGWGQGGGWRVGDQGGRIEGANVQDPSDVANTCVATLALLRGGSTPKEGPYAKNVANAIEFIYGHVHKADKDSLYVTGVRGTQVQSKIGPFVDTFLAGLVLAEVKGTMASAESEKRLVAALDKTIAKIEKNQKKDGTFVGNTAWASIFSQGLACRCLSCARQNGAMVSDGALARAQSNAVASLDVQKGTFRAGAGAGGSGRELAAASAGKSRSGLSAATAPAAAGAPTDAGVRLYNDSNQTAALKDSVITNKEQEKKAKEVLAKKGASPDAKRKAKEELDRIAKVEEAHGVAVKAVVAQLGDRSFVQGFGSNGGEEFLSYLNISETLVLQGGQEWTKWDKSITENLNRIQNKDGSWSGDHCITGRTFCTASALLVLMADRTPVPVAAKMLKK